MHNDILFGPLDDDSVVSFFNAIQKDAYQKIFILVDENTQQFCLPLLVQNFESLHNAEIIAIPEGEDQKDIALLTQLWATLMEYEVSRNDILINLGGGVITDLGGFLATTYKRGMLFYNVPTTLLGMVDAAIGGKNGINFQGVKNSIGTFNTPQKIIICPDFLATLPDEQIRSGFAEMLKHGLIADAAHFKELSESGLESCYDIDLIQASATIKQQIVELDFKESGLRMHLNYGHTIGHAIESYSHELGEPLLHGFAVAYGMCVENEISYLSGVLSQQVKEKINQSILQFYPEVDHQYLQFDRLQKYMAQDKKNQGVVKIVLLEKMGLCKIHEIEDWDIIKKAISNFRNANAAAL